MNKIIIKNFNEVVSKEDDLYLLGDIFLGGPNSVESGMELFNQLPGKIHLIWGNHDTARRSNAMIKNPNVIDFGLANVFKYHKYHFYLSHYPSATSNFDDGKPLKQKVLCLSGHTHSKNKFDIRTDAYNVAVDAHNCFPVSIDEIINDFKQKTFMNNHCLVKNN